MALIRNILPMLSTAQTILPRRYIHVSAVLEKVQSGRYKPTLKKTRPLTYEMANPPHYIVARKSWNSWNTSNIKDGNRTSETTLEDIFIRRFMTGTWHGIFVSEIIIKRQHNMVRIAGIIQRVMNPSKLYFLTGYTEEFLSYYLHCPVKLELVSVQNKQDLIYKYI